MEHSFNHPTIENKELGQKPSSIAESKRLYTFLLPPTNRESSSNNLILHTEYKAIKISSEQEYASNSLLPAAHYVIYCPGRGSGPRLSSPQDPSGSTFRARIHISSRHFYPKRSPGLASFDTECMGAVFHIRDAHWASRMTERNGSRVK